MWNNLKSMESSYFGFPINFADVRVNVDVAIGINVDVNININVCTIRLDSLAFSLASNCVWGAYNKLTKFPKCGENNIWGICYCGRLELHDGVYLQSQCDRGGGGQACSSHHQIVILICFWFYLTNLTNLQIVRRRCCLGGGGNLKWQEAITEIGCQRLKNKQNR